MKLKHLLMLTVLALITFACIALFLFVFSAEGPPPVDMKEMDGGFVVCVLAVLCLLILPFWAIHDAFNGCR